MSSSHLRVLIDVGPTVRWYNSHAAVGIQKRMQRKSRTHDKTERKMLQQEQDSNKNLSNLRRIIDTRNVYNSNDAIL